MDISLNGFQSPLSVPTEASKGGVLLYAKIGLNIIPRDDISESLYKPKELESLFVEVINPKEANAIVGVMYRHPSMEEHVFNEKFMRILKDAKEKENTNFYIAGDFDLLSIPNHSETFDFFWCNDVQFPYAYYHSAN